MLPSISASFRKMVRRAWCLNWRNAPPLAPYDVRSANAVVCVESSFRLQDAGMLPRGGGRNVRAQDTMASPPGGRTAARFSPSMLRLNQPTTEYTGGSLMGRYGDRADSPARRHRKLRFLRLTPCMRIRAIKANSKLMFVSVLALVMTRVARGNGARAGGRRAPTPPRSRPSGGAAKLAAAPQSSAFAAIAGRAEQRRRRLPPAGLAVESGVGMTELSGWEWDANQGSRRGARRRRPQGPQPAGQRGGILPPGTDLATLAISFTAVSAGPPTRRSTARCYCSPETRRTLP